MGNDDNDDDKKKKKKKIWMIFPSSLKKQIKNDEEEEDTQRLVEEMSNAAIANSNNNKRKKFMFSAFKRKKEVPRVPQQPQMLIGNGSRRAPTKRFWWIPSFQKILGHQETNEQQRGAPPNHSPPNHYRCAISGSLMKEPVVVTSGHYLERNCVEACRNLNFTPTLPLRLPHPLSDGSTTAMPDFTQVYPMGGLESAIARWCRSVGVARPTTVTLDQAKDKVKEYQRQEKSLGKRPMEESDQCSSDSDDDITAGAPRAMSAIWALFRIAYPSEYRRQWGEGTSYSSSIAAAASAPGEEEEEEEEEEETETQTQRKPRNSGEEEELDEMVMSLVDENPELAMLLEWDSLFASCPMLSPSFSSSSPPLNEEEEEEIEHYY